MGKKNKNAGKKPVVKKPATAREVKTKVVPEVKNPEVDIHKEIEKNTEDLFEKDLPGLQEEASGEGFQFTGTGESCSGLSSFLGESVKVEWKSTTNEGGFIHTEKGLIEFKPLDLILVKNDGEIIVVGPEDFDIESSQTPDSKLPTPDLSGVLFNFDNCQCEVLLVEDNICKTKMKHGCNSWNRDFTKEEVLRLITENHE